MNDMFLAVISQAINYLIAIAIAVCIAIFVRKFPHIIKKLLRWIKNLFSHS